MTDIHGRPPEMGPPEPPARPLARSGREVLERVMLMLSSLPAKVDRGPVVATLGGALAALGQLERSSLDEEDHTERLRAAISAVEKAHGALLQAEAAQSSAGLSRSIQEVYDALAPALSQTIDIVVSRQDLQRRRRAPEPLPKPKQFVFQSSTGAPRLFSFERPELPPLVRVGPLFEAARDEEVSDLERDMEGDATGDELAGEPAGLLDEPDEAASLSREVFDGYDDEDVPEQEAESRALVRLARAAAEEVGTLGLLRAPSGYDTPWATGIETFEERLLHNMDAWAALAEPYTARDGERRIDVIKVLLDWAGDGLIPDPMRAFARAFLLGSVAGDDTARAAVTALRQSHPTTYEAQLDALALAPHPAISALVERMLAEESPALIRVGLSLLLRRRQVSFEAVAPFVSHPLAAVRAMAVRCLPFAAPAQAALGLLVAHSEGEEDDAVRAATAESLLVMGSRKGLDLVRAMLGEEAQFAGSLPKPVRDACLLLLALSGGPSDAELLVSLAAAEHAEAAARALGFFGDASLVPWMLDVLAPLWRLPAKAGFCRELCRALHRITGLGRPAGSDPKQSVFLVDPPLDPGFWAAVWQEKKDTFSARRKVRFGSAFSPRWSVDEALTPQVLVSVRRAVLLELLILSRGVSRVHEGDWIAGQIAALGQLKEHFGRSGEGAYPDGQWPRGALLE